MEPNMTPQQAAAIARMEQYVELEEAPCYCGHQDGWDYRTQDRHGIEMTLRLCTACGLLRTNPRPTQESLHRYYREDFRDIYSPDGVESMWGKQVQQGEEWFRLLKGREPKRVVDVGCGLGGSLKPFYDAGCTVYGCDFDGDCLAYGRSQMPGAVLVEGEVDQLPAEVQDGGADLVIAWHTLEHRADLGEALQQHADLLASGGLLWTQVPTLATIRSHYDTLHRYLPFPHMWHFTDRSFKWALEVAGFEAHAAWEGTTLARYSPEWAYDPIPDPHEAVRAFGELIEYERSHRDRRALEGLLRG